MGGNIEPKLAQRRYKMLKAFLLVAGISFMVFIASIILDKEIFGDLPEKEVTVFAFTTWLSIVLFLIATIGSLVIGVGCQKWTPKHSCCQ